LVERNLRLRLLHLREDRREGFDEIEESKATHLGDIVSENLTDVEEGER